VAACPSVAAPCASNVVNPFHTTLISAICTWLGIGPGPVAIFNLERASGGRVLHAPTFAQVRMLSTLFTRLHTICDRASDRVDLAYLDPERASRRRPASQPISSQVQVRMSNPFTRLDIIHMYRDWASDRVDFGIFDLERRRAVGSCMHPFFTSASPNVVNPFTRLISFICMWLGPTGSIGHIHLERRRMVGFTKSPISSQVQVGMSELFAMTWYHSYVCDCARSGLAIRSGGRRTGFEQSSQSSSQVRPNAVNPFQRLDIIHKCIVIRSNDFRVFNWRGVGGRVRASTQYSQVQVGMSWTFHTTWYHSYVSWLASDHLGIQSGEYGGRVLASNPHWGKFGMSWILSHDLISFICIVIADRANLSYSIWWRHGVRASHPIFTSTSPNVGILSRRLDIIHIRDWASDRVDLAYSIWRGRRGGRVRAQSISSSQVSRNVVNPFHNDLISFICIVIGRRTGPIWHIQSGEARRGGSCSHPISSQVQVGMSWIFTRLDIIHIRDWASTGSIWCGPPLRGWTCRNPSFEYSAF
jgi:hypothetical protein